MNFQAYTIPSHPDWTCIHLHSPSTEIRTPIHLVCIIDTSASMNENNKLNNVKYSLQFLINFLTPLDRISIITFSEKVTTILRQTFITSDEKHHIQTRISFITHESITNLSSAIIESQSSLLTDTSSVKQGILLLTDGHANTGMTQTDEIIIMIQKLLSKFNGTSISCIGYGNDHNVSLLQSIATNGGGAYYVVNNLDHVATVFGDILGGLVSCSFQQISISLPVHTLLKTRYSLQPSSIPQFIQVMIGDLPAGMDAIFLAKLPLHHPITLQAYDLQQHSFITKEIQVTVTDDKELLHNSITHFIRFEVLSLIDRVLEYNQNTSHSDPTTKQSLIHEIDKYLIDIIPSYSLSYPHTLWDILKKELEYAKYSLENTKHNFQEWQTLLSQHQLCLGLMKGISSSSNSQDFPSLMLSNTFSSPLQRQFSNELKEGVLSQSTICFQNAVRIDTQEDEDEKEIQSSFAPPSIYSSSMLLSRFNFQQPPTLLSSISGPYDSLPNLQSSCPGSYDTVLTLPRQKSYYN